MEPVSGATKYSFGHEDTETVMRWHNKSEWSDSLTVNIQ